MAFDPTSGEFTSQHAREIGGVSYRQMNYWDSKGAVGSNREGKRGWRKMAPREFFSLLIAAEIHSKFGVPVERLRWMRNFMLQEGADHFRFGAEFMLRFKLPIYLLTDLRESFVFDSILEFEDLMEMGFFFGDTPQGYIFLNVSPIIARVGKALKCPLEFSVSDEIWRKIRNSRYENSQLGEKEREVVRLVRDRKFKSVLVHLKDGDIIRADTEEELSSPNGNEEATKILEAIKSQDYQTVTLTVRNGKLVHLSRKAPIKF